MRKKIIIPVVLTAVIAVSSITVLAVNSSNIERNQEDQSAAANATALIEKPTCAAESVTIQKEKAKEEYKIDPALVKKYSKNTKENIYHKMLNTIDFYNSASGSFKTSMLSKESETTVNYEVDFNNETSYEKSVSSNENTEVYNVNSKLYTFDNNSKTKNVVMSGYNKSECPEIPDDERVTIEEDGYNCYYYRNNPTNIPGSCFSLVPQEFAFGFLNDFDLWDISGTTTYLNRDCVVIKGTTESSYGAKLGTNTFEFIVDAQTGILLKYEGYDSSGNISDYVTTTEFSLDEKSAESKISKSYDLSKYSEYSPLQ